MDQHDVVQLAHENPPLFTGFIDYFESSDPEQWSRLMQKRAPWPLSATVTQLWQEELGHSSTDTLTIASVPPGDVVAELACWFKQAQLVQQNGIMAAKLSGNQEKRAAITIMHTDEQLMPAAHGFGNCWAIAQSSHGMFRRRTSVTEHTRTVPFSFTLPGAKANKGYAYHIVAFGSAYMSIDKPDMFSNVIIPSLSDLMELTQRKAADSSTLCHACGNAFCCNPGHLYVASKRFNDLQEKCHHFLHMMTTAEQVQGFQQSICALFHEKPPRQQQVCWTNNYNLALLDNRVTFSELTREEILEGEL